MIIKINETNGCGFDESILADIAKYKNLQNWLKAVAEMECGFRPLDCFITINDKTYTLIEAGIVSGEIKKVLNKVSQ